MKTFRFVFDRFVRTMDCRNRCVCRVCYKWVVHSHSNKYANVPTKHFATAFKIWPNQVTPTKRIVIWQSLNVIRVHWTAATWTTSTAKHSPPNQRMKHRRQYSIRIFSRRIHSVLNMRRTRMIMHWWLCRPNWSNTSNSVNRMCFTSMTIKYHLKRPMLYSTMLWSHPSILFMWYNRIHWPRPALWIAMPRTNLPQCH